MGILLGVLTALTWGGSDFLARFATERMGTLRTLLYMQFIGFILLTLALPWLGGWGHLADGSGWQPWAWGALAGCVNAVSTLGLYRSFEIGKMAVVAPLSASYPVLTVTLSLLSGEHLSAARATGIACTMIGVLLVAAGEKAPDANDAEALRRNTRAISLGMGLGDTTAFVFSNRAMQLEQIAVVSVLGSLYGAVTVALAAIVLREHVSRWQWLGIGAIFSGIYLMSR